MSQQDDSVNEIPRDVRPFDIQIRLYFEHISLTIVFDTGAISGRDNHSPHLLHLD